MPPLFLDWDDLYRSNEGRMSVRDCWERTKRVVFAHNILTLFGNVAILATVQITPGFDILGYHLWGKNFWLPVVGAIYYRVKIKNDIFRLIFDFQIDFLL